jgi:hypothetical protein
LFASNTSWLWPLLRLSNPHGLRSGDNGHKPIWASHRQFLIVALQQHASLGGYRPALRISVSVGMVTQQPDLLSPDRDSINFPSWLDQLFSRADEGTYLAKGTGGDRAIQVAWFQLP